MADRTTHQAVIECETAKEAELIVAGMSDPTMRAVVKVVGALSPLNREEKISAIKETARQLGVKLD